MPGATQTKFKERRHPQKTSKLLSLLEISDDNNTKTEISKPGTTDSTRVPQTFDFCKNPTAAPLEGLIDRGDRLTARIISNRVGLFLEIGGKHSACVPEWELNLLTKEAYQLLCPGAVIWTIVLDRQRDRNDFWPVSAILAGPERFAGLLKPIYVKVTGYNSGGLKVSLGKTGTVNQRGVDKFLSAFIPFSHVVNPPSQEVRELGDYSVWFTETYEGKILLVELLGAEVADNGYLRIACSEKEAVLTINWPELEQAMRTQTVLIGKVTSWKTNHQGQTIGALVKLTDDLTGMIPLGQISPDTISHPADVLEIGQEVPVVIINLDAERGHITLSRRQLLERGKYLDPWKTAANHYHAGQRVVGTVTSIKDFGAFVRIEEGLCGLLHGGEIRQANIEVRGGQVLELIIDFIDPIARKIGFKIPAQITTPASTAQQVVSLLAMLGLETPQSEANLQAQSLSEILGL